MTTASIRSGRAEDATAIVELIRAGFAADLVDVTIYGCSGVALWIAERIENREGRPAAAYTVAVDGGRIVGTVELRLGPEDLFLNYVAVEAEQRRLGLGSRLLRAAIEASRTPARTTMRLDVFESNLAARRWYQKLGFVAEGRIGIWSLGIPALEVEERRTARIEPDAASGQHARYGFSTIVLHDGGKEWRVGRLGERWFRVTDSAILGDDGALAALRTLDPRRRLLALVPDEAIPERLRRNAGRLEVSLRMSAEIDTVVARLG